MADIASSVYTSPWARGFTLAPKTSSNETRSTLALATALAANTDLALEVADRFLSTARYPEHFDPSRPGRTPRHYLTGEPDLDHFAGDPDEVAEIQGRIADCHEAVQVARESTGSVSIAVVPELVLYLPSDVPYSDLGGRDAGSRVDLSLCLDLPQDQRLQLLIEAKAKDGAKHQLAIVEGWGDEPLEQPLRYAAIWEEYEHPGAASDDPTCRVVGTIQMRDYADEWDALWQAHVRGDAEEAKRPARVAMAGDVPWDELKTMISGRPDIAVLQELMI